jgi:hypothetical protein
MLDALSSPPAGEDILPATVLPCTSMRTARTTHTDLAHFVRQETNMQRVGVWTIGIGLFITGGLLTMGSGYAEEKEPEPTGTLKTLTGRYRFAASGTLLPPAFGVTAPTPGADAGYHICNGDGTGTDTVTVRINGVTVLENQVFPLTYKVNADCTGSYTVPNGPSFDLFIAPNGEAIARIATAPPGHYVSSIARRVSRK